MQIKDTSRKFNKKGGDVAIYEVSDEDISGTTEYYGYVNADGSWIIQKIDRASNPSTLRYVGGVNSYSTSWANRASLSYDYYYNLFP